MTLRDWTEARMRFVAELAPQVSVDHLPREFRVSFLPLEAVWADQRYDPSRTRPLPQVSAGYTRFMEGDVLVPKITPTFEAARSAIAQGLRAGGPGFGTTELHVLRPGPDVDCRFLWYRTLARDFISDGAASMVGVAGQKRVPAEFVKNFRLGLPSITEQRRIADFLDGETQHLERIIGAKRRLQDLLVEKRDALYAAAAAGHLSGDLQRGLSSELPWLPSIPDSWDVAKLTLIATLGTGHTPSRSESAYWEADRDIPWITTGDIESFRDDRLDVLTDTKERISRIGLQNSAAVLRPKGTVALSRTASVGFSVVIGADMATSQDFVTWTCSPLLEPRFLLICLRAMRRDLVERLAMGSTHKTIYMPDVESLRIPLPPIREQGEIVGLVERELGQLDDVADHVRRQLPLFAEHRQALITAAATGQLDPASYRDPRVAA